MRNRKLLVACSCIAGVLFGGTDFIDFRTDRTAEGWELGDTQYNKDRGRKFVTNGDAIQSPAASSAVTSAAVVVSFTVSNSPVPRFHVSAGSDPDHLSPCATLTNRVVNIWTTNRFAFAASDDVRVLRVTVDRNGNGKTNPFVVAVGLSEVSPPAGEPSEPDDPPVPRTDVPPLPLSACPACTWTETFGGCTNLFPGTLNTAVWTNGVSLPSWQALQDGVAPTVLTRNKGAKASDGLYAYWDGTHVASYGLGMNVGSAAHTYFCGLALTNDTPRRLRDFTLAYTGRQYGFKNTVPQALTVEWRVGDASDPLDAVGSWRTSEALTFTTPAVGRGAELVSGSSPPLEARVSGPLDALTLAPGAVLWLRWRRARVTNAAALAIDDIHLSWRRTRLPTILLVR